MIEIKDTQAACGCRFCNELKHIRELRSGMSERYKNIVKKSVFGTRITETQTVVTWHENEEQEMGCAHLKPFPMNFCPECGRRFDEKEKTISYDESEETEQ